MKHLTCINCPNGCDLQIDEKTMMVTGNRCPRGKDYALSELTCPMRSLTSTVKTTVAGYPVISVRTSSVIKKADIFKAMKEINKVVVTKKMNVGDVVIKGLLGYEVDVIITSPMK
jgi:CxxC motif-containing protein